jgi:hypothetical protein
MGRIDLVATQHTTVHTEHQHSSVHVCVFKAKTRPLEVDLSRETDISHDNFLRVTEPTIQGSTHRKPILSPILIKRAKERPAVAVVEHLMQRTALAVLLVRCTVLRSEKKMYSGGKCFSLATTRFETKII